MKTYKITGVNYYGYCFGKEFETEYEARQYFDKKLALKSTVALTMWVNGEVVKAFESHGDKLVQVM